MLESDDSIGLPALLDPSRNQDSGGIPGSEVLEFLGFLSDEMVQAVEILGDETRLALEDGDASSRIRTVNALQSRKRKLEAHLRKELGDARSIIDGMRGKEDPEIIKVLETEVRTVSQHVGKALQDLMAEFEV